MRRLERLRVGPPTSGWVPREPASEEPPVAASPSPEPLLSVLRTGRFDPGRRGAVVLGALALLGALAGAWYFIAARPAAESSATASEPTHAAAPSSRSSPAPPASPVLSAWPTDPAPTPTRIVVDIVGKVVSPGVVELAPGARVRDAIEAAGGALPGTDLTALNLASKLSDGQQVFVGIPPPSGAAAQAAGGVVGGDSSATTSGGGSSSSGVVDLNTATLEQLENLPGVGPVLAQHILDWRTQHGRFTAVTQLQQVSGIGPSKYADIVARVRI